MSHHARRAFLPLLLLLLLAGALGAASGASAQGGRYLDPRLPVLGVSLVEAQPSAGELYWRIERVEWQNEQEARGRHHIDVEMLDEQGRRALGQRAVVRWQSGTATMTIEDKPAPDYGANFAMYAAGCSYSLEALGLPSDRLECLGLGDIERRQWTIHTTFRVTFQRVRAGGGPGVTPTATAPVLGWRLREYAVHPNCGLTRLMGVVQDANERGLAGHRVEVTWEQPGAATFRTTTNSIGQWEIFLNDRPHSPGPPGWRVTAFDQAGRELVRGHVMTDATNCAPGARNVIELAIEPVAAPITATPILPLPTATVPGYPAPGTPTPRATATPPLSTPPSATATATVPPGGSPGGKAIYTGFPDNVTLLYQCSEGAPVAVPVPVGAPTPLGYELRCVIEE